MKNFAECISCPTCKDHFTAMFNSYKRKYPQWNSSRRELFIFVCRAHNTVNKRIDKPVITLISQCIETIKNNSKNTSLQEFRKKYILYLLTNWSGLKNFEGMNMGRIAREMEKINSSYWNARETDISNLVMEDGLVDEFISDTSTIPSIGIGFPNITRGTNISIGFKMRGGRLKLGIQ